MNNLILSLISAMGMIVVAGAAVIYWRRASGLQFRWFWAGAGLWAVAVALKLLCYVLLDGIILAWISKSVQSRASFVGAAGLYLGARSSLFEMGLTFLAALRWRQLGRDANRAIGIGFGAGAWPKIARDVAISCCFSLMNLGSGSPAAMRMNVSCRCRRWSRLPLRRARGGSGWQ